jgi:aminoglycoside phosphotransferase (APT) family kinase protein
VLYGDPSPEILIADDGAVGLIDWGTPSWGPQLHDVTVWLRWLGERPGSGSRREAEFLRSYAAHAPLSETDTSLLPLYGEYANAFGWAT